MNNPILDIGSLMLWFSIRETVFSTMFGAFDTINSNTLGTQSNPKYLYEEFRVVQSFVVALFLTKDYRKTE